MNYMLVPTRPRLINDTAFTALLLDQFPGATALLSLSKENSAYGGACIQISSSTGTSQVNIGFTGTGIDMTALNAALAGGLRYIDTVYDQSGNGNNAVEATLNKRYQIIVDTDGNPTAISPVNFHAISGMSIADNASHKTTVIDAYMLCKLGYPNFDGVSYTKCFMGWMADAATDYSTQARWAWGTTDDRGLELPRNATAASQRVSTSYPTTVPLNASRLLEWTTWQYNSNRLLVRANDDLMWDDVTNNGASQANVTYSGTGKIYIGMQADGAGNANMSWRTIVLYGTTRSDHAAITSYINSRWSVNTTYPTSYDSGDGFLWTPEYSCSAFFFTAADDANGLRYAYENPGMRDNGSRGPSMAVCNNVTNGKTLYRTAIADFDSDVSITGAERVERDIRLGASTEITKGDTHERFVQFWVEPGASMTGTWCYIMQTHYGSGATSPDMYTAKMLNNQIEFISQRSTVDTSRSTPAAFSRGVWYALRVRSFWSAGSNNDDLQIWFGLNGTTLTQITNVTGASIYDPGASGANCKQGIYRGYPNFNDPTHANNGVFAIRWANEMFSKSSGAYASFVTTQPALPTH